MTKPSPKETVDRMFPLGENDSVIVKRLTLLTRETMTLLGDLYIEGDYELAEKVNRAANQFSKTVGWQKEREWKAEDRPS